MAIARCEEAGEPEKLHSEAYQKAWEEVETYKRRRPGFCRCMSAMAVIGQRSSVLGVSVPAAAAVLPPMPPLVKRDHIKYLPCREGNVEVKEAVSRLRVYCRPGVNQDGVALTRTAYELWSLACGTGSNQRTTGL